MRGTHGMQVVLVTQCMKNRRLLHEIKFVFREVWKANDQESVTYCLSCIYLLGDCCIVAF